MLDFENINAVIQSGEGYNAEFKIILPKKLKLGISNPLIFGLFERINMVEQIGSGVTRIKEALKTAKASAATYKFDGIFTIIFNRTTASKWGEKWGNKLSNNELAILAEINKNSSIKIRQLSALIGIGTSAVENNIKKLKNKDIIRRIGSARKGHWKIL